MYTRNLYLDKIKPFMDKPVIKIITGIRRSGKSSLLKLFIQYLKDEKHVQDKQIIYINKESLDFAFIESAQDLNVYVMNKINKGDHQYYLIIDEVQMIHNWQIAVNSFLSDGVADIYITGSNSRLLSSELASLLAGRYIQLSVQTLSFNEFCHFANNGLNKSELFKRYIKYGGFPGLHEMTMNDEVVFQYISAIFDSIVLKDIVLRHNIRNVNMLEKIIYFIMDNVGNIFSANKVVRFLKNEKRSISVETVYNYLKHLESPFIISKVKRYDLKGKKHLEINEKYYLSDIGLRHALLGFKEGDISAILENIIYLELLRRGFSVYIGIFEGREIDFVVEKENKKAYIQVTYLLASENTIEREFGVLKLIKDNYPKYVLSLDEYWGRDMDGIERLNIIEFLTDENSL